MTTKEQKNTKHDHACYCGGASTPHETGIGGCLRQMTEAPKEVGGDFSEVEGHRCTGDTLRGPWLYHRFRCGCWSRPISDDDSPL